MGATLMLPEVSIPRDGDIMPNMSSFQPGGVEQAMLFCLRVVPDLIMRCVHRPEVLPAGFVTKALLLDSQGLPVQTLTKTQQQKTQGVGRGRQDASQTRRTSYKDDAGFPAGKKGGGKSKSDIIEQYVREHGAHRCKDFCEICPSHPKQCCHWENR